MLTSYTYDLVCHELKNTCTLSFVYETCVIVFSKRVSIISFSDKFAVSAF